MDGESRKLNSKEEKRSNKALIIVCIVAVLIIMSLVGIIIALMKRESAGYGEGLVLGNTTEESKRPVVVTEDNIGEIINRTEPEREEVPLSYQVTMNSTWEFENSMTVSENAYVANSENNETAVYFDVIRNDTQEIIYQSPVIPIGEYLDSVKLDKNLDAGNYECTLTYHLIDDEQNTLTTVNMWLMVKVKN